MNLTIPDISILISVTALIISIIALTYTIRSFSLKRGVNVRGSYSTRSSVACADSYVGSLTLENFRDRSLVIYRIYLLVGHNYFLEIEEFEDKPLVLKPFEVFHREYEPIDFYSVSSRRIDLSEVFGNRKIKHQLLLSTAGGKFVVKEHIRSWNPLSDFFNNYLTAIIHPIRSNYKGKSYGGNVSYIVDLDIKDGKDEVIPIYPRDYEIKKFKNFQLTKNSLESSQNLEEFLYDRVSDGKLSCRDLKVYDMDEWRKKAYEIELGSTVHAEYINWFQYRIIGRIYTLQGELKIRLKNKIRRLFK